MSLFLVLAAAGISGPVAALEPDEALEPEDVLEPSGELPPKGLPQLDELEHLGSNDGLSHDTVWSIFQDSKGFMWFLTSEGVNRYDGYRFTTLRHERGNADSLVRNQATAMAEDAAGNLWISTSVGLDRYDRAQRRFTHYRSDSTQPGSLPDPQVYSLGVDGRDRLWVGTAAGLARFVPASDTFEVVEIFAQEEQPAAPHEVSAILASPDGSLWLGVNASLCRGRDDASGMAFECWSLDPTEGSGETSGAVRELAVDGRGRVWATTWGAGLRQLDPQRGEVRHFRHRANGEDGLGSDDTTAVVVDKHGAVWVGTDSSGLFRWDPEGQAFDRYQRDPHRLAGLSDNGVLSLFLDRQGLLWIGSYLGVDRYDPSREAFRTLRQHPEDLTQLVGLGVWALHQAPDGELWVGTYTEGLERFSAEGRRLRHFSPEDGAGSLRNGVVSAIVEDGVGGLWVGTWGGLHRFDRRRETFSVAYHRADDDSSLASDRVYHLLRDSRGELWISLLSGGVDRLLSEPQERRLQFKHHRPEEDNPDSLAGSSVYQTLEDHRGDLWFATNQGLDRLPADQRADETLVFEHYVFDPADPRSLSGNEVGSLFEDSENRLWVGTDGHGVSVLDAERHSFRRFDRRDGLPSDMINGILGDDMGGIWLSTGNGLARFDMQSETFRTFGVEDGLQGRVYSVGSMLRSSAGELFFGGTAGLDRFWPSEIRIDTTEAQPVLTDFLLFNRSAPLRRLDPSSPLTADIGQLSQVTLDHRQYVFGFELAALHFASPRNNLFEYQLEGFDPDWIRTGPDKRFAQYSNLPSGEYVFRLRSANEDGLWSSAVNQLRVVILPAPWRTWWAYTFYMLALLGGLAFYIRGHRRKLAYEQSVNDRLREVNRMKDEFLANTSHELRTPLYGIIGITESLIDGVTGRLPVGTRQNLSLIAGSARRLSALVNDILDFSKLSARHLELQRSAVDLRSLCDVVLTLSAPLIGSKELKLRNLIDPSLPAADADEARLQQILLNLLGNAIKFTESGRVEVSARVEGERIEVSVTDTGIGVPEEQRESIFGAFEQGDASTERQFGGTGLGLAVTRKLVNLHGGTIGVRAAAGHPGAEFYFTLPIHQGDAPVTPGVETGGAVGLEVPEVTWSSPQPVSQLALPTTPLETVPAVASALELPPGELKILIVDDEPVNRQVLLNHLALEQFVVESASSGAEALRQIEAGWIPDLVLLDVMMPKMSGYEVCRALRQRFRLTELPVIFLTAKNQPEDQVTGLAQGANDYLTKPVTRAELLSRVRLHLELLWVHRHLEEVVQERTAQVKTLGGLLPVCGLCKSVRDDSGYWSQLEEYLCHHSEAQVTHGICPSCLEQHYGTLLGAAEKNAE